MRFWLLKIRGVAGPGVGFVTSRRRWVAGSALLGLMTAWPLPASAALPAAASAAPDADIEMGKASVALVDVLVPADAIAPSASQLGVGALLVAQAKEDAVFGAWLGAGLAWLDQGTAGSFAIAAEAEQTRLVETLAAAPPGSQLRTFLELIRLKTMTAYYADPRSQSGMAIERPPQPLGYPDFAGRA